MQVGGSSLVLSVEPGISVIGLSSGPGRSQITCTMAEGVVKVLDMQTGLPVHSWAGKAGVTPALPAAVRCKPACTFLSLLPHRLGLLQQTHTMLRGPPFALTLTIFPLNSGHRQGGAAHYGVR